MNPGPADDERRPRPANTRPRLLYLTTHPVHLTPHAEWNLWILSNAGWQVECVAPGGDLSLVQRTLGTAWRATSLFPRDCSLVRRELQLWLALWRARFGNFDVIFIDTPGMAYRAAIALAGPWFRKKLVYQARDFVDPWKYRFRSILEGIVCRRCHLHVNHEYHRAYLMRTLHRMRCPVVLSPPNLSVKWPVPAPDPERRRQIAGRSDHDSFVLCLHGGISDLRKTRELLEAMARLPTRIRLAMTGGKSTSAAEARQLLTSLDIAHRVVMLPPLEFNEMLKYTVCADAGVLLYANNDLGNFFQCPGRMTEYLACGLPVLASNFTGLQSLVSKYKIGVCVDAEDPRHIADGILELEHRKREGQLTSKEIRWKFENHFALEHWAPLIAEAFRRLLEKKDHDPSIRLRNGWMYVGPERIAPWEAPDKRFRGETAPAPCSAKE